MGASGAGCPFRDSTLSDTSRLLDASNIPRSMSYTNGLGLVLGLQIGSGIFSSPSAVINSAGSPILAMVIWFVAGILAWTGASSFIELGSIVPINGGMQEYLRYCYHDICGFLAALTWIFIVKPCGVAMISLVFSEYLTRVFAFEENQSIWISKGIAFAAIVLITKFNCMGIRTSAGLTNGFLVVKLIGLASIIATGFTVGIVQYLRENRVYHISLGNASGPGMELGGHLGSYTDAILAALWAYSGWEAVGYFLEAYCHS